MVQNSRLLKLGASRALGGYLCTVVSLRRTAELGFSHYTGPYGRKHQRRKRSKPYLQGTCRKTSCGGLPLERGKVSMERKCRQGEIALLGYRHWTRRVRRHHETHRMCAEDFLRSKEKKAPKLKSTTIKTRGVQCVLETANSSQYAWGVELLWVCHLWSLWCHTWGQLKRRTYFAS